MEENRYYGLSDHGVVVGGYGKKYTFTKGWGKYKKKCYRVFDIDEYDQINDYLQEMRDKGWGLASVTDVKL